MAGRRREHEGKGRRRGLQSWALTRGRRGAAAKRGRVRRRLYRRRLSVREVRCHLGGRHQMMDTDETPRVAPSPLPPHSCRFIGHNKSDDWKEAIHFGEQGARSSRDARRGRPGRLFTARGCLSPSDSSHFTAPSQVDWVTDASERRSVDAGGRMDACSRHHHLDFEA